MIAAHAPSQHEKRAEPLRRAESDRSRHGSDDFDRGYRQQRVLTSLREQANIANLIPRIPELFAAFKKTVRTDIPRSELAKLAGLAGSVDSKNIRFMEPGQSIAATLSAGRYEQAGRSAAKDPGTTAIVIVHDVRQALAWLCGRTDNAVTCGVAHRAANMTIDTPLPLT